jgi:hypothetical protein
MERYFDMPGHRIMTRTRALSPQLYIEEQGQMIHAHEEDGEAAGGAGRRCLFWCHGTTLSVCDATDALCSSEVSVVKKKNKDMIYRRQGRGR